MASDTNYGQAGANMFSTNASSVNSIFSDVDMVIKNQNARRQMEYDRALKEKGLGIQRQTMLNQNEQAQRTGDFTGLAFLQNQRQNATQQANLSGFRNALYQMSGAQ